MDQGFCCKCTSTPVETANDLKSRHMCLIWKPHTVYRFGLNLVIHSTKHKDAKKSSTLSSRQMAAASSPGGGGHGCCSRDSMKDWLEWNTSLLIKFPRLSSVSQSNAFQTVTACYWSVSMLSREIHFNVFAGCALWAAEVLHYHLLFCSFKIQFGLVCKFVTHTGI